MDIRDKLIISYPKRPKIETIDLNDIKNNNILFNFREYEEISIQCISETYKVKLECISYICNDVFDFCDENLLTLESNKTYFISKNENDDVSYRPSKYQIIINSPEGEYVCFFDVLYNREMPSKGMDNVIEKINDFLNGLSLAFFKKSTINNINRTDDKSEFYIYDYLAQQANLIGFMSEEILNNIKSNIVSIIKPSRYEEKQNLKSIKKNLLKNDNIIYNSKKVVSYENNENIILKKFLLKTIKIINNMISDINNHIISKKSKIELYKNEISSFDTNNKARFDKTNIENNKKSIVSLMEEDTFWITKFNKWQESYLKILNNLKTLVNSDYLKTLSVDNQINYSPVFFSNRNYKFFKNLYENLVSNSFDNQKQTLKNSLTDKRSFQLFEIYGYIILRNILLQLNFYSETLDEFFEFTSGKKFTYFKEIKNGEDKYRIEVIYDFFCKSQTIAKEGEFYSINSYNCKPDYIIAIYKNDIIIKSIILEIKYRNLRYMFKKRGTTETDTTLNDYYQLACRDNFGDAHRISKVFLLYPSIDEKCFEVQNAEYIGINTEKDFNESIAYNKIKNQILKYIS